MNHGTEHGTDVKDTERSLRNQRTAMRLSLAIGFLMLLMKTYAYAITRSAAILSDAAESVIHVLAVSFAAYSLWLSSKPADKNHPYGHDRIGFFSAGFEGAMIMIAALYIIYEAVYKWIHGLALEQLEIGISFIVAATIINGILGGYLVYLGKKHHSIILEANGKHVLTDSWTSLGVIAGLILVMLTDWLPFDPIIALLVALNILLSGFRLMRRSIGGLMDEADPDVDRRLREILKKETDRYGVEFHQLRHRNAGDKLMIEFHLLFNREKSVAVAHEEATLIEKSVKDAFPIQAEVITHLEPLEDHDEAHSI